MTDTVSLLTPTHPQCSNSNNPDTTSRHLTCLGTETCPPHCLASCYSALPGCLLAPQVPASDGGPRRIRRRGSCGCTSPPGHPAHAPRPPLRSGARSPAPAWMVRRQKVEGFAEQPQASQSSLAVSAAIDGSPMALHDHLSSFCLIDMSDTYVMSLQDCNSPTVQKGGYSSGHQAMLPVVRATA